MDDSNVTKAQLFIFIVPGLMVAVSVALVAAGLWPVAVVTAAAAIWAGVWGRRMLSNERVDEAIAAQQESKERDVDDASA